MLVEPTRPVNGTGVAGVLAAGAPGGAGVDTPGVDPAETRDMFLRLLITQLRNQNPLDPMDPTEMLGQLSQLTALEQLVQLTTVTRTTQTLQRAATAAGLLGTVVGTVDGRRGTVTQVTVDPGGAMVAHLDTGDAVPVDTIVSFATPRGGTDNP